VIWDAAPKRIYGWILQVDGMVLVFDLVLVFELVICVSLCDLVLVFEKGYGF